MKNVELIVKNYVAKLHKVDNSKLQESYKINESLRLSLQCLNELRLAIRTDEFQSKELEINFFKYQKPYVHGRILYFSTLQKFQTNKPKSNIAEQRNFIKTALRKLEIRKNKQSNFFHYYRNAEKSWDQYYFLRGNEQLEIYIDTTRLNDDLQFSTSHCKKAAEIVEYDLLTSFYENELKNLIILKNNFTVREVKPAILKDLSWTASKTDLIELIYALHISGALRNGSTDIKKIIDISSELFNIDLGNYYKTYAQIKDRQKDSTKFLDKLKFNLIQKLDLENRDL